MLILVAWSLLGFHAPPACASAAAAVFRSPALDCCKQGANSGQCSGHSCCTRQASPNNRSNPLSLPSTSRNDLGAIAPVLSVVTFHAERLEMALVPKSASVSSQVVIPLFRRNCSLLL
jgi:hypothetical protein